MDDRCHPAFAFTSHRKVDCRASKTGNLPGGLFARTTINFSVWTRVMVSLSPIYNKYAKYYLILAFLCMKYAVKEEIWKIFVVIYKQCWEKDEPSSFSVWPAMRSSADHSSIFAECCETSAECRKAQCVPGNSFIRHEKLIYIIKNEFFRPSVWLSARPSECLPVRPSDFLSVRPSECLSVRPSVTPFSN